MANYRYVYEYAGRRYVIEAPEGATEDDLQAIVAGAPAQAAAPAQRAKPPAPKKEEESVLSGVLPTLKKSAGELGEGVVNLLQQLPSSASLFNPILGERKIPERPVATALKRAATGLRERGEAELPQASIAERARQAAFVKEAAPGLGSKILSQLGQAGLSLTRMPSPTAQGLGFAIGSIAPSTPEEAAKTLAKVQAPLQTARGASEFIAEQALPTLIPLGFGKGVQLGTRALRLAGETGARRAAAAAAVGSSTAINAASAGQQAYTDVLKAGGTEEEAQRAFKIAAGGAGLTSGVAARLPGLEQTLFSGAPTRGGIIRGAARAAAGEIPQEFIEEGGTQLATNVAKLGTAAETPIGEDVLSSAILGGIAGGALGAPVGGIQGFAERRAAATEEEPEAEATRTAPPATPPAPPPDMGAISKALGPVGGKVTLQEPTGAQEYIFDGFDEDGNVLLVDEDGSVFAEDPGAIAQALKAGEAESEMGVGAVAFGEDITEGLPEVEAVPTEAPLVEEPAAEAPAEKPKFTLIDDGSSLPIDENILPQLKQMERSNTPSAMASLEKEARQIAVDQGATSVSSMHFAQALNNAASRTAGTDVPFAGDWQQAQATAAPVAPPAAPAAVGKQTRATIPTTREKVEVQYELQDLDNIRFAEGQLQNRDRSRPQTQQFLRDFTSTFDPEGVGEDNSTDRGAPIINDENVILSGNGRTMGLEEIYANYPEQAQAYRDYLSDLGYDTEGMNRPVLVRRLLSDVDQRKFVVNSNIADIAGLSPPEMARQDAQDVLTPELLAIYYGGDLKAAKNDAFVGRFIAKLSTKERADAMDAKGNPSLQVLQRIRNALLYKAYGESGRASEIFISKAMERADDDTKTLTNSLVEAANDWIKFQQDIAAGKIDPKYDITNKIMEAVATVSDIKQRGLKVRDALRADDLVEPLDPFVKDILLAFHNEDVTRFVSKNVIANILNNYAETAAVQQATPDMLGMAETPSADELWRRADRETPKTSKAQGQLLSSFEPVPVEQQQEVLDEARKIPSLSRGVTKLIKQREEQLIDDAEFASRVTELADFIDYMKDERNYRVAQKGRVRGADRILEVLLAAKRRGDITPEAVDFIAWALQNNPNLANDLAISMQTAKDDTRSSGNYSTVSRLITLFKNRGSDSTAVHELLHHIERMMPEDVQQAIRKAWLKAFNKEAAKHTQSSPQKTFFQAVRAFHSKTKLQFAGETLPPQKGYDVAMNLISSGYVPYSYYQYVNPSEFWAVNATDIMQKRYDVKDSTLGRMRNWMSELVEKAKGLFGLSSKSPLIKALDSLSKADGKFNSLNMLQEEGAKYMEVSQPEDGQAGNVVDINAKRNAEIMDIARAISNDPKAANLRQLEGVIDLLDEVYASPNKGLADEAARIQDQLMEVEAQLRAAKTPLNDNVLETELQKAERQYDQVRDEYNKFFYNPDDERAFSDRRTKEHKAWRKEADAFEAKLEAASQKFEELYRQQTDRLAEKVKNGTPDEMKKAIAKIAEPDDKIMNERANLQKQNRGCD